MTPCRDEIVREADRRLGSGLVDCAWTLWISLPAQLDPLTSIEPVAERSRAICGITGLSGSHTALSTV
jgi:hypothetical protein